MSRPVKRKSFTSNDQRDDVQKPTTTSFMHFSSCKLGRHASCRTPKRARRAADELEHLTLLCTSSHEKSVSKFKLFCDSFVPYFELFTERRFYRYNRRPGQWHSQTTPTSLAQGYYNRSMPKTSHFLQYTRQYIQLSAWQVSSVKQYKIYR